MSIWSDVDIERHRANGDIRIEPWDEKALQPASVDLRLGSTFRRQVVPKQISIKAEDLLKLTVEDILAVEEGEILNAAFGAEEFFTPVIHEEFAIIIQPQEFILAITKEKISLNDCTVGRLEGKSSLARIGISVHSTGGFIDPGNQDLNITLEIVNHLRFPVKLHVGMWIAQIAFQSLETKCKVPYGVGKGSRYYADSVPVVSKIAENLK